MASDAATECQKWVILVDLACPRHVRFGAIAEMQVVRLERVSTLSWLSSRKHQLPALQWARVSFNQGIRTVPAGSLQFVDFTRDDPAAERVERFMTAAKHALAEGDFALAARRLVFARDAEPRNAAVLRLLTTAYWQAGDYAAAARAVRDWIREEPDRPAPYRTAARIYDDMGSLSQALDAAEREVEHAPRDASAWERLGGCGCAGSIARARARRSGARGRWGRPRKAFSISR